MQRLNEKDVWESASAAIRATGARNTTARTRVLAVLLEADVALSEPQIEGRMQGPALDCVTIYRVLEWLVDVKLVHRVPGTDGIWRFAPMQDGRVPNAVFECLACGSLVPLRDAAPPAHTAPPGYEVKSALLHLHGTCAACLARGSDTGESASQGAAAG